MISVEEYLATSYDPDVEYLDGELVDRCIEILSKDYRAEDIQEKVEEYLAFGVKYISIINHRKRLAYVHTAAGMTRAEGGLLKTADPEIIVPLATVWPKWTRR